MFILMIVLVMLCSAVYVAIEAMKNGMSKKGWFLAGICFGPIIFPMFNAKRKMALLKSTDRGSVRFYA